MIQEQHNRGIGLLARQGFLNNPCLAVLWVQFSVLEIAMERAGGCMAAHNIIVIGGSAGGIEPLRDLVAGLPVDLQAALFVVIHFPPSSISYLAEILNRKGCLPASPAKDGEIIQHG